MIEILATNALVLLGFATALWVVSLIVRDASIVDIFWGLGFALVAWVTLYAGGERDLRSWLVVGLVSVWGVRLAGYLAWRNHGAPEDYRYRAMREARGRSFWWQSLFVVFLLQAALTWVVSLPVQVGVARGGDAPLWLIATGVAVWAAGMFFESVGDWQLARFKADPASRGEVMDRGLWRYTRHPNYFGDFLVWWGVFAVTLAEPVQLWTAVGPAVMTVLLLRVSGVALLEKDIGGRRPGYRAYAERTSAFVPWPPKPRTSP